MYEASNKQVFMECLSLNKSLNNLVPLGEAVIDDSMSIGDPVVDLDDSLEGVVYEEQGEDAVDVSGGDVSGSDVSLGDVSSGSLSVTYTACLYEPKPNLWESDISEFDTTDGLLLLILVFVVVNTMANVFFRRW